MLVTLMLVTVLQTPSCTAALLEGPSSLLVTLGSPASLTCRSSLSSSFSVTWSRNDRELEPSPTSMILPSGELFLLTTTSRDTGEYSCQLRDREGVFHSDMATLTVLDKELELEEVTVSKEEDLEIRKAMSMEIEQEQEQDEEVREAIRQEIRQETLSSPPTIILASIPSPATGLVQWEPVQGALSYTVRVFADQWQVTNITVERGVDRVKLHNLATGLHYSVSIAVTLKGGNTSLFSPTFPLLPSNPLATLSTSSSVPSFVWIISITIVVFLTVLTVLSVSLIFTRVRSFHRVASNAPIPEELPTTIWRNKRMSWMDPRWTQRDTSTIQSPTNTHLLMCDTTYDNTYSNSSNSSNHYDNSSNASNHASNHYSNSNHYAYIDIVSEGNKTSLNSFGHC